MLDPIYIAGHRGMVGWQPRRRHSARSSASETIKRTYQDYLTRIETQTLREV